jgi:hypothetical protein
MKSLLIKYEAIQDPFHLGDLVINQDSKMIVLVNSTTNEGGRFNGTVIVKGESCVALGVYEKGYYKNDFELFHGEIKLTQ